MEQKLKYSVLRYSPSMVAGESINLGVLVCSANDDYREFCYTTKWSRVKEFDDELDVDVLKTILRSIKDETSKSLYNMSRKFEIDTFVSYYTNEYHFDPPIDIYYDDFDKSTEEICKMYLRYDYDKKQRPSREQEIAFISKLLKNKNVGYKRNTGVFGSYDDKIVYDYIFQDYGIKIFHLKKNSINKMMNDVKAWAWNCEKNKSINSMIFYDYDSNCDAEDNEMIKSAIRILKDATSEVYGLEDGIARLNKLLEYNAVR